jgi:hypothetical protein
MDEHGIEEHPIFDDIDTRGDLDAVKRHVLADAEECTGVHAAWVGDLGGRNGGGARFKDE